MKQNRNLSSLRRKNSMSLTDMDILMIEDNPGDAFFVREMLLNCKTPTAHLVVFERGS